MIELTDACASPYEVALLKTDRSEPTSCWLVARELAAMKKEKSSRSNE
jgi:hypothetical protein